jgi:hypothetical protein
LHHFHRAMSSPAGCLDGSNSPLRFSLSAAAVHPIVHHRHLTAMARSPDGL